MPSLRTFLLMVASAVSVGAYQQPVSRRGWLGKVAAASGVTAAAAPAIAAGDGKPLTLVPATTLYAEMIDLKALVGEGVKGNPVQRVVDNSLVPLQRAMDKNPNNTPEAATNAAELKGHMFELAAAMAEPEGAGYAPYLSKSQGKMYDGGRVERELEEVLETTVAYCKKMDCEQLFMAR